MIRVRLLAALAIVVCLSMLSAVAIADTVVADIDYAYPSGGSGAERVLSAGGTATVDIAPASAAANAGQPDPVQGTNTPAASLTFTATTQSPSADGGFIYKPPDTHAAVGPGAGAAGRIVMVTNSGVEIFDKTGSVVAAQTDLDVFLTGLGAAGMSASGVANFGFDPKVIYDQHSGRFFIVILDGKTPNPGGRSNVHICTSTTSTPGTLSASDWTVESASTLVNIGGTDTWFDYPGIGVDSSRLVVTGNMFSAGGAFIGVTIRVFDKSSLTDNGTPAGATFNDIIVDAAVTSGPFTIQPCHHFGSTLNGDFYLINRFGSATFRLWQITGAGGAATLATGSPTSTGWTAGTQIAGAVQAPQSTDTLNDEFTIDTLSSRVMNAVYRNTGGAAAATDSIWTCLSADTDSDSATEVVWFQIDPNSTDSAVAGTQTTPTVLNSGSIDGAAAGDWTFMPSITVNQSGDVAVCFSQSSSTQFVDMRVATMHPTEGGFSAPVVIATSPGEYDDFGSDPSRPERWGDYSACVVDPDNDEDIWIANEVVQSAVSGAGDDGRWGTRIALIQNIVPVELAVFSAD